jgi:hypothetical protein
MSTDITEAELAAALARNGVSLSPEEVRALLPGARIMQGLISRVNAPLPREAEPALIFTPNQAGQDR